MLFSPESNLITVIPIKVASVSVNIHDLIGSSFNGSNNTLGHPPESLKTKFLND